MANNLASNTPKATPARIEDFEGQDWDMYPLETIGVATPLERWVAQFVRRNVELLRPDDDNEDPVAWRSFNDDVEECRRAIRRGDYNALMPDWLMIVCRPGSEGFKEAIFQSIRFRNKDWTREHVKRLLEDEANADAVYAMFDELNFPKANARLSKSRHGASANDQPLSTGNDSLPEPACVESSQANSTSAALVG